MTRIEKIIMPVLVITVPLVFLFWKDIQPIFEKRPSAVYNESGPDGNVALAEKNNGKKDKKDKKGKKDKKSKKDTPENDLAEVKVIKKWEVPAVLVEISGLAYYGENKFACVQDELGKIFIYNSETGSIEKEIPFAGKGDYEGIAIAGKTAYVVRADGLLYEVNSTGSGERPVKQYRTHLTAAHDVEGLCYDGKNNRLLFAIKGSEPASGDYKGIYAFDLSSKKMAAEPAFKIYLAHSLLDGANEKKAKKIIEPSGIEVHPGNGDIYMIDGPDSKLLIMDKDGNKKKLYNMGSSEFIQPEGITISPTGELFISNEGKKESGNILEVSVDE